ncbi:hypothetical protein P7C70_g8541, partial [Phenoliferia sp. Uapishka_3]
MRVPFTCLSFAALAAATHSSPSRLSGGHRDITKRCSGTISSVDDVNIEAFTVPVGKTFDLSDLLDGTTVNVLGEITFATGEDWSGPLAEGLHLGGTDITFNGNGYKWNGNGAYWWDGEGSNGGLSKTLVVTHGRCVGLILHRHSYPAHRAVPHAQYNRQTSAIAKGG